MPALIPWPNIEDAGWESILIGNGASRAVWDSFRYESLLNVAFNQIRAPLQSRHRRLFDEFETTNFETVMSAPLTSARVNEALGYDTEETRQLYASIKTALIESIHQMHLPWRSFSRDARQKIRDALSPYATVYSTNYDLLIYWSIMDDNARGFTDFMWTSSRFDTTYFDISDLEIRPDRGHVTRILYLHGALHLVVAEDGKTHKRKKNFLFDLLSQFGLSIDGLSDPVPLFVSEGTSEDKLRAIRNSDYLSFAYQHFSSDDTPLVVFGHSLSAADSHISKAINRDERRVAVGLRPGNHLQERMARVRAELPSARVIFFDSTTHPLGDSSLRVEPDP